MIHFTYAQIFLFLLIGFQSKLHKEEKINCLMKVMIEKAKWNNVIVKDYNVLWVHKKYKGKAYTYIPSNY